METATQLARSTEGNQSSNAAAELLQIVTFQIGKEIFGLDILKVHEIIRFQPLTRVPNLPDYVEGVLNLRGKIIPVVGLRQRMGLDRLETNTTTKIVVASVKDAVLGFLVDSVSEVLRISGSTVEPAPRLGEIKQKYVSGVGKLDGRLLLLLDLGELLSEEEKTDVLSAKAAGEPN
ncbi:MAG: chemotaxis protein CheW [Candidatus Sulfotelmatobacter sp.]